jgi:hypothetical protein
MSEYSDKMLNLRKSTSQALDEPKPSYRVTAALPKGGDIDEQFALIETEYDYGSPASDPTHRKIQVGDSLPEGEVTGITSEGIKVIPDVGDEYVIPLGGKPGYKQPGEQTKKTKPITKAEMDKLIADHKKALHTFSDLRQKAMELMTPFSVFNPDGTIKEPPIDESIVSSQGLRIRKEALDHKLAEDTLGVDDISDIIDQHQKDTMYSGIDENALGDAAKADLSRDQENKYEMWSGDGPEGEGEVVFYTNDDDETTGYWLREGKEPQNVTGMLFPPTETDYEL